jgi:hypothetical protein
MKIFWVLLIASILFISFSGMSFAAEGTAPPKTAPAKAETIVGKIVSIDTAKKQVTIEHNKTTKLVDVTAAQIASLKANEEVKVTLKADGKTVKKIEAEPAKAKK